MARLPSAVDLGAAPSAASGRQISSIDGSAIGQGMQTMASGMRQLAAGQAAQGQGLEAMGRGIAKGFQQVAETFGHDDELADAQRRSDFMVEKIKLDGERDRETDPAKLATYAPRYEALAQKYATQYKDPRQAQKFKIFANDDIAKATERTTNLALGYQRDAMKGQALQRLEALRVAGLKSTDPEEQKKITDQGAIEFQTLREKGVLTPAEEVSARQKWVKGFIIDSLKMKPPEQRIAALEGSKGVLRMRESSGDPGAENTKGYAGLYQFGAPRLQTLGVYQPGPNEDLKGWADSDKTAPGKWSGTFNIPGFPNVKTKAQFLANEQAQEAVYAIDDAKKSAEIKANGLDKYIGQTVGGIKVTEEGIKNMIHLGGVGGASAFLTSGGVINAGDQRRGGNAKLSEYLAMGAAGKGSGITSILDPLEQKELREAAAYELMQKSRIAEQEQRQAAAAQQAERAYRTNALEVGILDGTMGREDYLRLRQDGTITDADKMQKIERLLEAKNKEVVDETKWNEVLGGRRQLNQFAEDDQAIAEIGVKSLVRNSGGQISEPQAAMVVYEKARIMPQAGVVALRGALASQDVERVKEAASVVTNILASNPTAFRGQKGADDLESDASAFKHYAYDQGLGPDAAAKKIIESKTDEYKRSVKVTDPEAKKFKDDLEKKAINDLANGVFEGSGWFKDNIVGANPAQRAEAALTYAELATDNYRQYGDPSRAKAYALEKMNKIYGVSNGVLMKYPAEMAYPPVNGSHKYIYDQAVAYISTRHPDQTIDPASIQLTATTNNRTAMEFLAGGQPPYQVQYSYKVNGQTIHNTMPASWRPDVKSVVAKNIEQQQQKFNQQRQELQTPSMEVRVEDTAPTGIGKRVRPMAEREAEAVRETELRKQAMRNRGVSLPEDAPKAPDGKQPNAEAVDAIKQWEAVDAIKQWWNTPLSEAYKKRGVYMTVPRNRLPGKPE